MITYCKLFLAFYAGMWAGGVAICILLGSRKKSQINKGGYHV